MKVTVCFGNVRVIVPCGNGELPVQELISKAVTRYKKATGKPADYWVAVHNLKTCNDGGILDPDDLLNDVADDREQIIADFAEQGTPVVPPNDGDGMSASSIGTASPDIFQDGHTAVNGHKPPLVPPGGRGGNNDVVITEDDLSAGSSLIVRRGSEPVLNTLIEPQPKKPPSTTSESNLSKLNKRWSAVLSLDAIGAHKNLTEEEEFSPMNSADRPMANGDEKPFSRFARDSARQSLASNTSSMYRWLDAQERTADRYDQMHNGRKEPVGGPNDPPVPPLVTRVQEAEKRPPGDDPAWDDKDTLVVVMPKPDGPLGIHVVPNLDKDGRDIGMILQGIDDGGRVHKDGRLKKQDVIVKINGSSLIGVNFQRAQELFRQALDTDKLALTVVRKKPPEQFKKPPPVLPKPVHKPAALSLVSEPASQTSTQPASPHKVPSSEGGNKSSPDGQSKPNSPTKKVPPAIPARTTSLASPVNLQGANTRKIGKKITIDLVKGSDGLGFSVTTRDNPAGGNCPIYVKNILPKGAAITDGRLRSGDRLLEVNGQEMTGKTQGEAVAILRNMKQGSQVSLVVSRQVTDPGPFALPRELSGKTPPLQPPEKADDEDGMLASSQNKELLSFDIPLNDTGSAGLGLSVKGKTLSEPHGTRDLGIFIKAVINGGAASKDGRLRENDQLIEVNGENLQDRSNTQATELLRKAMQKEGPQPGYINIVVARRISVLSPLTPTPGDEHREFRISMTETPKQLSPQEVSNDEIFEDTSVWSAYSDEATRAELEAQYASHKARNSLINRLLGGSSLRNVSYQKALHDTTLNESDVTQSESFQQTSTPNHRRTVSTPSRDNTQPDTVMIEGGGYGVQMRQNPSQKPRPASTLGFAQPDQEPSSQRQSLSRSNENLLEESGPPQPPTWLTDWDKQRNKSQEEPLSPSPEDPFRREGFGRQSISEKRKNHLDPKVSEFYLHMKQKRDDKGDQVQRYDSERQPPRYMDTSLRRASSAESLLSNNEPTFATFKAEKNSVGPTLGLKKSSSLESLQAALQGVEPEEEIDEETSGGVTRGRGCNESFRAAVDRSYDPVPASTMETLLEEGNDNGSRSAPSSFSDTGDDLNRKKRKSKKEKDKGGIFKGFGNMFKFGKNRKTLEDSRHIMTPAELKREHEEEQRRQKQLEINHYHARKHQNNAQMDRDEVQRSRKDQDNALGTEMQPHPHQMLNNDEGEPAGDEFEMMKTEVSRTDRIQQLRIEHQRKHRERQGKYPLEDKEEQYEKELQEIEKRRQRQALQKRQEREQQDRQEREVRDRQEREVRDRQEREVRDRQEREVRDSQEREVRDRQECDRQEHERQEREMWERQEKEAEREHRAREQEQQSQRGSQSREPVEIPPKRRPPEQNHRAQEVSRQVVYRDPEHYSHYQNLNEIQANLQKHDQYQQKYRDYFGQQPRRPAPPLHQTRITVHQQEDRSYNNRREPSGQEYQSRSRYDNPDASRYYNNNRNGTRSASDSRLGLDPRGGYMGRSDYDQRRPSNQDRTYYRNNSASLEGGNSWGPPSYNQHRRSVTPIDRGEDRDLDSRGPPPSYRGYHPAMVPPNAYPPRYDSRQPPQRGRMEQSRGYTDFDDPRIVYHNQRESSSSMPSREWHRNGSIPGSAQV